jgi:hypothetical protein
MTEPFRVHWTRDADEDWRRLPLSRARVVAIAVDRFASGVSGHTVIFVDGECRLFVEDLAVVLLLDGDDLYVMHVRRA